MSIGKHFELIKYLIRRLITKEQALYKIIFADTEYQQPKPTVVKFDFQELLENSA